MTKRRANGEGSVGKRKDGRWMARFYIICPDGTKKRVHIFKKTRREAVEAMQKEIHRASYGAPVTHDGRTVGEWLEYWHEHIAKQKIKFSTWYQYEMAIRLYLKPTLGHLRLSKLAPHHVQEMINNKMKDGYSARMCVIIRNTLSASLTCAVRREIVHRNVSRMVDLPQDIRKVRDIWTGAQIKQFLGVAKTHRYFLAFKLLCTYGLRRGETLGIRWCDIDFEAKTISINQQLIANGRHIYIGSTKTNAGKRTLPMTSEIEELLAAYPRNGDNESLIFQTRNGTWIRPNNFYKMFRLLSKRAGLPLITVHDVRHSVATVMKEADVPIKDAQMLLGHADPATTMRIYQHSSIESKKEALNRITNFAL